MYSARMQLGPSRWEETSKQRRPMEVWIHEHVKRLSDFYFYFYLFFIKKKVALLLRRLSFGRRLPSFVFAIFDSC
jgi:hypothetical protein